MEIYCENKEQMLEVVYGLVLKGLTFKTTPDGCDHWKIELTGGY